MKRTYQPHSLKRVRKHGFMSMSPHVIRNRRSKGRKVIGVR